MRDTVLILTNTEDDLHTLPVIDKLLLAGQKVFRFDVDTLTAGNAQILITPTGGPEQFVIVDGSTEVSSSQVKSVWYRRPCFLNMQIENPAQRRQAEAEVTSCLEGVWLTLSESLWVSDPCAMERARKKILQLVVASRLGFQTPRTIVTNDPGEVQAFYEACGRRIVYKTLKQPFFDYSEGTRVVPTTIVTAEHMEKLELIRSTPSLFQELLEKSYELRVTVVGQTVFAAKIRSQEYEETRVDWRNPAYLERLGFEPVGLPQKIEDLCQQIVQRLGLNFGAIDLVVDSRGNHIFLEVNPNGQWQWLEYFTQVNISGAIAEILINRNA